MQGKQPSMKITDVKTFLKKKNLHMLCLVEADLHSSTSRYKRLQPLTTKDIHENLEIPGYRILLPRAWGAHGQARVMVYARNELKVTEVDIGRQNSDLPTITFEIGLGREKKTIVNFFYREFTGGVSGLDDINAQTDRLSRQVKHWKFLHRSKRDIVCLGDANLCAMRWYEEGYSQKDLAQMIQSFLVESASNQLIKEYTRSEVVQGGEVSRSCIDHLYKMCQRKCLNRRLLLWVILTTLA